MSLLHGPSPPPNMLLIAPQPDTQAGQETACLLSTVLQQTLPQSVLHKLSTDWEWPAWGGSRAFPALRLRALLLLWSEAAPGGHLPRPVIGRQ
jgi:hypothetical protein